MLVSIELYTAFFICGMTDRYYIFHILGYNATTDFPGSLLYKHYLERNPTSKVILSVRDNPMAWAKSVSKTIARAKFVFGKRPFTWMVPGFASIDAGIWGDKRFKQQPVLYDARFECSDGHGCFV